MNAHRLPNPDATANARAEVEEWIRQRGVPLSTNDPNEPLRDLASLAGLVGDAVVVGLGGSTYGAHEQFAFGHRLVRFLVEEKGFRAVATEEDWDIAHELNRYVLTGAGDLDALIKESGVPWRVAEMRAAVAWIREYNVEHDEKVRFVGVGVIDTKPAIYEEVAAYVEQVAPASAAELAGHFEVLKPARPDHVRWFIMDVQDKAPHVERARQALKLVQELGVGDAEHALMVQHVRQIVAFYEHYAYHLVDDGYRDEKMAENVRWWHQHTGDKIVYWSTNAHSVRAAELTISVPPRGSLKFKPAGAHLAELFGDKYFSLGITFDHGEVNSGWSAPPFSSRPIPAPAQSDDFAERLFTNNGTPRFLLNLHANAPDVVREWLNGPVKARVIGSICDPSQPDEHYMTGGSLAEWYDAILHEQVVTPSTPL